MKFTSRGWSLALQSVSLLLFAHSLASPISSCPGYSATNIQQSGASLTADLILAGSACNTYGTDVTNLKLEVDYETENRIHVKISDSNEQVYQVPSSMFPRPSTNTSVVPSQAAITFSYVAKPFSFSILRSATNEVLFDTSKFPLVFQSQYLRLVTSLPSNPNLYGLGEHTDTFLLPTTNYRRTMWSRDAPRVPAATNLYGNHPVYYDHRIGKGTHGVFLLNSNGMDIEINNTATDGQTLTYHTIGGIIDLYFMAGPTPVEVAQQYSEVSGKPAMMPYWGLGYHQCSGSYRDVYEVAEVVANYSAANIPLETMWTDYTWMSQKRDFVLDPANFPLEKMQELITYLHDHGQQYILIIDPGIGYFKGYPTFDRGVTDNVFLKLADGTIFKGVVWPGNSTWADWFHPNATSWWSNEFALFFDAENGVDIDGAWIDMNEPSNFCGQPCTDPQSIANSRGYPGGPTPGRKPPRPIAGFPADFQPSKKKRTISLPSTATGLPGRNLLSPAYKIHNAAGSLSGRTVDTSLIHANGLTEYDTHNLFGAAMSYATYEAMLNRRPTRRPFVITRSTFAGAGAKVGHWLGDNQSLWIHYQNVIAGILNFATFFQLPMVGADTCGFSGSTTESLCSRWAMLGAFSPFYRNHNGSNKPQEYFLWPKTVAVAARKAIALRYKLLDYFYTALHQQSALGTPALNPLWFIYPEDSNTFSIQTQYFFGDAILVSPVMEENATSVTIYLPNDIFYDAWNYETVRGTGKSVTLSNLDLTDMPVHIRGNTIIPMRIAGAMTTKALRQLAFNIVIAPGLNNTASGRLYLDDGDSIVPATTSNINLAYSGSTLTLSGNFGHDPGVNIGQVTLLGAQKLPGSVSVNGTAVASTNVSFNQTSNAVTVLMSLPLTAPSTISFH